MFDCGTGERTFSVCEGEVNKKRQLLKFNVDRGQKAINSVAKKCLRKHTKTASIASELKIWFLHNVIVNETRQKTEQIKKHTAQFENRIESDRRKYLSEKNRVK